MQSSLFPGSVSVCNGNLRDLLAPKPIIIQSTCPLYTHAVLMTNQILHLTNCSNAKKSMHLLGIRYRTEHNLTASTTGLNEYETRIYVHTDAFLVLSLSVLVYLPKKKLKCYLFVGTLHGSSVCVS